MRKENYKDTITHNENLTINKDQHDKSVAESSYWKLACLKLSGWTVYFKSEDKTDAIHSSWQDSQQLCPIFTASGNFF